MSGRLARLWLAVAAVSLCFDTAIAGGVGTTVIFVHTAAVEGTNDGSSWADAFVELPLAVATAKPGDVIWVAAGIYHPGRTRASTFQLADDIALYGGFAGTETPGVFSLTDRDFATNETILTGTTTDGASNVYHVVTANGTSRTAILDGFTITGGLANGISTGLQDVGGGLLIKEGSPTIRHCLFLANRASTKGGAVHLSFASPLFEACRFIQNATTVTQAAANFGGGIYSEGDVLPSGPATLVNCLFVGNRAGVGSGGSGGGLFATPGNRPLLINCTFSANHADTSGGGVWGAPRIIGSILWSNTDGGAAGSAAQVTGAATITHSCIEGGWSGTGNIEDDPRFIDLVGPDGEAGTRDDDLGLGAGSPAIDAGDSTALSMDIDRDLAGHPRFINDPTVSDTGVGDPLPVVDMGAFEFQATCLADSDCFDGRVCNGIEVCVAGLCQPGTAIDCNDGIDCTLDVCEEVSGACLHEPRDADCDNDRYCDGVETCDAATGCLPGLSINCDDGVACTVDSCDEALDSCIHQPDDTLCDNGLYCDGVEVCDEVRGCLVSDPVLCDDGIDCTTDRCDEDFRTCVFEADDALCSNGVFCDGVETCLVDTGCAVGPEPCATGVCDEMGMRCVECLSNEVCDDDIGCTIDECDVIAGVCVHTPVDERCDDLDACTVDSCDGSGCVFLTIEGCCAEDSTCGDGLFCNGVERCVESVCTPGTTPCAIGERCDVATAICLIPPECLIDFDCDDGNPCTDNACESGVCTSQPGSNACDDADECTENDTCLHGTCVGNPIPNCGQNTAPDDGSGEGPAPTADRDSDGVSNDRDQCPETPASEPVDADGCSCSQRDADGDGVNGCLDECPGTNSGASVDATGCPLDPTPEQPVPPEESDPPPPSEGGPDSDSDGVIDELDQCPTTRVGVVVGEDGCPVAAEGSGATDVAADAALPVRRSPCGACGAVGLIPWLFVTAGMVMFRRRRGS